MKKVIILLVAVLFVVSLGFGSVGCKKEMVEETAAETTAADTEETAAEATAAEATEPVELLFWNFGVYGISYFEQDKDRSEWYISKAIKRFEDQNPGITIQMEYQDATKALEMMTAAALAGKGPDVTGMWGGTYVKEISDSLLPLNKYFTQEEMAIIHGWENHAIGEDYFGAPIAKSVTCIFYNKSLFEQAGIDASTDYDGTVDGLIEICEKLKTAGIKPMINGVADGWGLSWIEGSIFASQVLDPVNIITEIVEGKRDFAETPELVAAFKANQDFYVRGYYNEDVATINREEGVTQFVNGKGAMFAGNSAFDTYGFIDILGENLAIMSMPSFKSDSSNFGTCVGGVGPDALVATKYGLHPDEAIRFIKFLRTYEEEAQWVKETGMLPCIDGDYSNYFTNPIQEEFMKFENVVMMLDNLMPGNVANTWWSLESLMLTNQMTVEEFLTEMDTARDEALEAK